MPGIRDARGWEDKTFLAAGWDRACQGERRGHTLALFALASVPGRILSRLLLSASCQNIWHELPATHWRWVPGFKGAGRGGTS